MKMVKLIIVENVSRGNLEIIGRET